MIERIYILCIVVVVVVVVVVVDVVVVVVIKSEVWAITHCLELGHETMVTVVTA